MSIPFPFSLHLRIHPYSCHTHQAPTTAWSSPSARRNQPSTHSPQTGCAHGVHACGSATSRTDWCWLAGERLMLERKSHTTCVTDERPFRVVFLAERICLSSVVVLAGRQSAPSHTYVRAPVACASNLGSAPCGFLSRVDSRRAASYPRGSCCLSHNLLRHPARVSPCAPQYTLHGPCMTLSRPQPALNAMSPNPDGRSRRMTILHPTWAPLCARVLRCLLHAWARLGKAHPVGV
jgi:hypothetical protein